MNVIIWAMAGALTGLFVHMLFSGKSLSKAGNLVTGCAAALAGGWLLAPLFGVDYSHQDFHAVGLMIALLSAVIGLSVVHLYREGT